MSPLQVTYVGMDVELLRIRCRWACLSVVRNTGVKVMQIRPTFHPGKVRLEIVNTCCCVSGNMSETIEAFLSLLGLCRLDNPHNGL